MRTSFKLLAIGSFAAFAALGSVNALAEKTDGSDYHPLQMNSPDSAEIQAGAVAAAHPSGTEPVGQSTSPAAMNSTISVSDIQAGAYAASHPTGTEPIGQSTSLPMVKSGTGS